MRLAYLNKLLKSALSCSTHKLICHHILKIINYYILDVRHILINVMNHLYYLTRII